MKIVHPFSLGFKQYVAMCRLIRVSQEASAGGAGLIKRGVVNSCMGLYRVGIICKEVHIISDIFKLHHYFSYFLLASSNKFSLVSFYINPWIIFMKLNHLNIDRNIVI